MAEPLNIDVAAAEAALAGMTPDPNPPQPGNVRFRDAQGQYASKPEDAATPVAEVAVTPDSTQEVPQVETPAAPAAPEGQAETTDEEPVFTHIDDSVLSPELLQMKRSLQADYTRKTQEAAPWRKLSEELGVESPEDFRDAAEIYTRLQDPRNWPQIHAELAEYIQQYGMTPAQANAAAAEQLSSFAPADGDVDEEIEYEADDPDLAPVLQHVSRLEQRLAAFEQQTKAQQERAASEAQMRAVGEGLTRMETQIRGANPDYDDSDIEAIYNIMGEDGNLFAARDRYESLIGGRVAKYIASKQVAQRGAPVPLPGGQAQTIEAPAVPENLDEAHSLAMAHLAQLEAEGGE